jgi:hypothetical protein
VCPNQPGKPIKLYILLLSFYDSNESIALNSFCQPYRYFSKEKKITLTLPKISVYDALFFLLRLGKD